MLSNLLMSPCRILLVDDNRFFLKALGRLLAPITAIEVVGAASSGPEALTMTDHLRPDLVLMDLVMPGMSGLETTRLLTGRPLAPLVVIMTVNDDEVYRTASVKAGADAFLSKLDLGQHLQSVIQRLRLSPRSEEVAIPDDVPT